MFNKSFKAILLVTLLLLATVINAAQTVTYFHNDISGSPLMATDAGGNVVWKENYYPYGERLKNQEGQQAASINNKLWFTGKPHDEDTGLSYLGARYYNPMLGRFMGIDPVGFNPDNIHSFNRYTYANNNPYRYIDPDGRTPIHLTVFSIGFLINVVIQLWGPNNRSLLEVSLTEATIAGVSAMITGGVGSVFAQSAIKGIISAETAAIGTAFAGGTVGAVGSATESITKGESVDTQKMMIAFSASAVGAFVGAKLDNAYSARISTLVNSRDGVLNHIGDTTREVVKNMKLGTSTGQQIGKSVADLTSSLGQKQFEKESQ